MLLSASLRPGLDVDAATFEVSFNREPFGFAHNLGALDIFSFDSLAALASKYVDDDYFVASSAPAPDTKFYDVRHGTHTPSEALERLDSEPHRILMKRPEKYDARFRDLLDSLFAEVLRLRGGLGGERIERLDSSIFVSSGNAITPFHFDPEVTFFFQIEGDKRYHVFSPRSVAESELEHFYVKGIVNIGQLDFQQRNVASESSFDLCSGKGLHQPQNAPHWVETGAARSISYAFSFETDATRAVNRTRGCNHYLRRIGLNPSHPGRRPALDAIKAETMRVVIPVRKALGKTARLAASR